MTDMAENQAVAERPPSELLLDTGNPRFGGAVDGAASQRQVLDYIADQVGVRDLLSSISTNGFQRSAPLVAFQRDGGECVVVEGNRRLTTVLILVGDERATGQVNRRDAYPVEQSLLSSLDRIPVLLVKSRREVLRHLGISHIVGNKTWDSFAKAAWAADVLDKRLYDSVEEISKSIGDIHRTLPRMVEAYRLVKNLKSHSLFDFEQTAKKGRGSAGFPFSWIYTALGYQATRRWLRIEEDQALFSEKPPVADLKRAAELMGWLLGREDDDQLSLISDSRQISGLAAALADDQMVAMLRSGQTVAEAAETVRPSYEKILEALAAASEKLKDAAGLVSASTDELADVEESERVALLSLSRKAFSSARTISRQLSSTFGDDEGRQ